MKNLGGPFGVCVSVPEAQAGDAIAQLGEAGLRDERYRVQQADDRVLVPVTDGPASLDQLPEARLVETELEHDPRRAPIEIVREQLAGELDGDEQAALPEGWTRLGDVLLLRLSDELAAKAERVAQTYADVLGVDSVLHLEGSTGEAREPVTEHLWGEPDTETTHREHGLVFHLDPAEVMFSPGNHAERHRLTDEIEAGETVVDLFAGIGYFTLPLARAGAEVLACELNPTAASYLQRNADANDLAERIDVREGDCRDVAPTDVADRVHLGYFPGTQAFLSTAVDALAPRGGWIHHHDQVPREDPLATARRRLVDHEALADADVDVRQTRVVKTLDPRHVHVALDARVDP